VVSPRPFAPPVGPYSEYASLPDIEDWGTYTVHHPRFWYLLPKRLLYGLSGNSYANRIPKYVEREFEVPDLVHACHIYPDGYGMLPYVREHDLPLFVMAHGKLIRSLGNHPPGVSEKIRNESKIEPGTVVELSGEMSVDKTDERRDADVAGVASSNPAMIMAKERDGIPIAMSGTVPVKFSHENGEVAPGDMLTTASEEGHAMKCSDVNACTGAIIGKAMEPASTNATVNMLVSLG